MSFTTHANPYQTPLACLESGLGLQSEKDESTKQQQYVVKDRRSFQKTALLVLSTLACLAVSSVALYSSRAFLYSQVQSLQGTLAESDFNEDLRTAELFIHFLNQIAATSEMGERTDIFLDMEKAAEYDLESSLLSSLRKATGETIPAAQQEAVKKTVTTELLTFEKTVDQLVEETIGQQDEMKRQARAVKGDVETKLRTTLTRISQRASGNPNRQSAAEAHFAGMIDKFFENFELFEQKYGKQTVPMPVAAQLSHLIQLDSGEEQPSIRQQRLEKAMLEALPDPVKYGVPPYEGKMRSGHHYEEYMKRVVIVKQFQRARMGMKLLQERWQKKRADASTVLNSIVQLTNKHLAPSLWLTQPCVHNGDWTYAAWNYDIGH